MSSDEIMVNLSDNLCLSGGADGADLQWGMMAGRIGHSVIHWSFPNHNSKAPSSEIVILDDKSLSEADDYLVRANKSLKRRWPASSLYTSNLLRRNHYQVKWASSLYAVGVMKNNVVQGGTAWAVQMYIDRFTHGNEHLDECKLYFFDQSTNKWFFWKANWKEMDEQPPCPSGIWAGVGSRELTHDGKWAIRNVMGGYEVPTL